ncbi:MAG: DMT family transporter [Nanoarchaeota archaeon]
MEKNRSATISLLIGTIFWGMTFVLIKEATSSLNLYNFLSYRFLIAAAILALMFITRFKKFNLVTLKYGLLLSIPLSIGYITQTIGLQYTTASKAAFITGLSVVLVPIILAAINKAIPKINHICAAILATIGLGLLTLSESFILNIGDIWALACAIAFAAYIIMVGKYTKNQDSILLTFVQLSSVAIITGAISLISGGFEAPKGRIVWQAILFCSIFATSFMYAVQNHYQKYISEVKAAIIFSFEPLFAAMTAYFYIHEQLTSRIILGGVLIFAGMIVSEAKLSTSKKPAAMTF